MKYTETKYRNGRNKPAANGDFGIGNTGDLGHDESTGNP